MKQFAITHRLKVSYTVQAEDRTEVAFLDVLGDVKKALSEVRKAHDIKVEPEEFFVDLKPGQGRDAMWRDVVLDFFSGDEISYSLVDKPDELKRFIVLFEGHEHFFVETVDSLEEARQTALTMEQESDGPIRAVRVFDLDEGKEYGVSRLVSLEGAEK